MSTLQIVCYNMFSFSNGFSALRYLSSVLCLLGLAIQCIIVVEKHWIPAS